MTDTATRYHSIDHLRATMIGIVMFGHALLPYVTLPRAFKDPATHWGFDTAAVFLYGFAMPAFFVTAGFSTALIYHRKGAAGLARNRWQRIFLPLLIAYLLISPLVRGAYTFADNASTLQSLQAGADAFLRGEWLRWSKPYHLWFLVSLLLYSALAVGLRAAIYRSSTVLAGRISDASRQLLLSCRRASLFALPVALFMAPAYIWFGADATTLPMQIALFGFFALGWLLYKHRDLLPALATDAWPLIGIALLTLPLAAWTTRIRLLSPDETQLAIGLAAGVSNALLASFMSFGLIGLYEKHFSRPSVAGRYLSDASYWIYLIHFPLVIAAGGVFSVLPYSALVKYLLTLLLVVPLVWASYHYGVRATALRRWLSGSRPGGTAAR